MTPAMSPQEYKNLIKQVRTNPHFEQRTFAWPEFERIARAMPRRYTRDAFNKFFTEVVTEPMVQGIVKYHPKPVKQSLPALGGPGYKLAIEQIMAEYPGATFDVAYWEFREKMYRIEKRYTEDSFRKYYQAYVASKVVAA